MELFCGFEFCLWDRRQSQTGTVSVGSNNLEASVGGFKLLADVKGNKSGVVSGEEILGAFFEFPVGSLAEFLVAFLSEFIAAPVDNVEWGAWNVDEIEESLGEDTADSQKLFILLHEDLIKIC